MSGEDDTFDIDIYGDEDEQQQPQQQAEQPEDEIDYSYTEVAQDQPPSTESGQQQPEAANGNPGTADTKPDPTKIAPNAPQANLKRKASEAELEDQPTKPTPTPSAPDSRPVDPGALPSLKLTDLHWWTTEEDLRAICASASTESEIRDLSFGEHKINGKSRGEAYLEFTSPAASTATKREVERRNAEQANKEPGTGMRDKFQVWYTPVGNPYRGKDGGQGDKKFGGSAGKFNNQGGAYNNSFAGRGGYGGRGRGDFNNRGGGYGNNNMMGRGGGGGGFNNNMGGGGMNGGFQNPMMGMMGGYGNMGGMNPMMAGGMRGGMNPMMNRGGFGGGMPNMNMMGMMGGMNGMNGMGGMNMGGGGRGGGNMMGRGGWGGGGMGGSPGMQNKKPRTE